MHPHLANIPLGFDSINGEPACPIEQMPEPWPSIARGEAECLHPEPRKLIDFMRLFFTKMEHSAATLEYYGRDWSTPAYPDFAVMRLEISGQAPEARLKRHVCALFERYGYSMPGSFYRTHLLPLGRMSIHETRYLRFSREDEHHVRASDAILHAQNVFDIHDEIQSMASEEGFRWRHGCDCKHSLAQLADSGSRFNFRIPEEDFEEAKRSFIWRMLHEYAFFPLAVTTRYVFT